MVTFTNGTKSAQIKAHLNILNFSKTSPDHFTRHKEQPWTRHFPTVKDHLRLHDNDPRWGRF